MRRWEQLEADPELAGPWHQLFKQVQSPRHVLSELLQNADDAGASEASARIENGVFQFSHNGHDFQSDHFESLCRFGYSNKRSLHTIGFRGIGFKSTFSLGPIVGIQTPTLSVYFAKDRFTLPCWYDNETHADNATTILVKIEDKLRQTELAKNLTEWKLSPVSLLFFQNIRKLTIDGQQLFWRSKGLGPIPRSQWYILDGSDTEPCLLACSEATEFPKDCLDEIRQERILGIDSDFSLPPSRIELVLGVNPGVYVVLPTAVKPNLSFACNGPFMQDPARVKIKDPEISPTNRWLLERVGKLAAQCMCDWLANTSLDMHLRAEAYKLLPRQGMSGIAGAPGIAITQQGIEGSCASVISKSFLTFTQDQRIVLAHDGSIEPRGKCIALAKQIQDVWEPDTFSDSIDPSGRKLVSPEIPNDTIDFLYRMAQIDKPSRAQLCKLLQHTKPPNPGQEKLLKLWTYISVEVAKASPVISIEDLSIVPIAEQSILYPSCSAVRLSDAESRLNEDDLHWLASQVFFVDRDWLSFLAGIDKNNSSELGRHTSINDKGIALSLLKQMGLADGQESTKLIERITLSLMERNALDDSACIRIAHICARLECNAPSNFFYLTGSGEMRQIASGICHDHMKSIEHLLPHTYARKLYISDKYWECFLSCSSSEWQKWVTSAKAGLKLLPPLHENKRIFRHAKEMMDYIQTKFGESLDSNLFPYKWERQSPNQRYEIIDYDIAPQILAYWDEQESVNTSLSLFIRFILESSSKEWFSYPYLRIYQSQVNGQKLTALDSHGICASWQRRFRDSPCIPDTRGNLCKPNELLRRSKETEPLIGVERFIEKRLDHAANDIILDSLGVSAALPGPHLILSLLSALSEIDRPPQDEVVNLYEQLDKIYLLSNSEDQFLVKDAFEQRNLVLTDQGEWTSCQHVFISADDFAGSGITALLKPVQRLSLWRQLGLPERPNEQSAIKVISEIPIDTDLGEQTIELCRAFLRRFTNAILKDCEVWITVNGQLKRINELSFGLADNDINTDSLFHETLGRCADLRFLDSHGQKILLNGAFLQDLGASISFQLADMPPSDTRNYLRPQWLRVFGLCVSQLDQSSTLGDQSLTYKGNVLAQAPVSFRDEVKVFPTIEGKPIGRCVDKDGALIAGKLYIKMLPEPRLANLLPLIIGNFLHSPELQAAAAYCYERPDKLILEYFCINYDISIDILEQSKLLLDDFSVQKDTPNTDGKDSLSVPMPIHPANSHPTDHESISLPGFLPLSEEPTALEMDFSSESSGQPLFDNNPADQPSLTEPVSPAIAPLSQEVCAHNSSERQGVIQEKKTDTSTAPGTEEVKEAGADMNTKSESRLIDQYGIVSDYARSIGLSEISEGVFGKSDEVSLRRQRGELFPWILEESSGVVLKYFIVKTTPFWVTPLELDAVAFGILERFSDTHSILFPDTSGKATEITGTQLQSMIAIGRIKVFPSSYRLVAA